MDGPYRYATPVRPRDATGRVARVYGQMARDFLLVDGPLMSLSPAPELLAATWALLREAQLAGQAPRVDREVVATAIAVANRCPFCAGAHAALVHATGNHRLAEAVWRGEAADDPQHARLAEWASATATADAAALEVPPFPMALAGEYLGTALVSHFINRMTSALLDEETLGARLQAHALVRRAAGLALARRVRRRPRAGDGLELLLDLSESTPPEWGRDTRIGHVYAVLRAVAGAGGELLGTSARDAVLAAIEAWDGGHPPLGTAWLEAQTAYLSPADLPGARLALLAALAPYRVSDEDVAAWRTIRPGDAELIGVLAFGAISAVDRIAAWTTSGWTGQPTHDRTDRRGRAYAERSPGYVEVER